MQTLEFGKGFTVTNLKYMRQFYRTFPNRHTLCDELSWSHYRLLMRVEFLIGTNNLTDRVGILEDVGASYILLRSIESDNLVFCDIYSIKFVTISASNPYSMVNNPMMDNRYYHRFSNF